MHGDRRVDEIASQRPEPRQRAILVGTGEAAESDDIGGQDRGEFAGFGHRALFAGFKLHNDPLRVAFSENKRPLERCSKDCLGRLRNAVCERLRDAGLVTNEDRTWTLVDPEPPCAPAAKWIAPVHGTDRSPVAHLT